MCQFALSLFFGKVVVQSTALEKVSLCASIESNCFGNYTLGIEALIGRPERPWFVNWSFDGKQKALVRAMTLVMLSLFSTINTFQGFMWSHLRSRNSSTRFLAEHFCSPFIVVPRPHYLSLTLSLRRQAQSCGTPWSLDPKNRSAEARIRERMNPDSEFMDNNKVWLISVQKIWLRRTKSVRENFVSMTLRLLNTTKKISLSIQLWRTHTSKQNAKKRFSVYLKR